MKKFLQKKLKDQKGMTLIELLAVIVIIAIIAAIAIPAIGSIIENSRVGAIKSDALNVISAANLYYADNPNVTTAVTIDTLEDDYLQDIASFTGNETGTVTKSGLISAIGKDGDVSVTFGGADKEKISSTANNVTGTDSTATGTGSVTVDRDGTPTAIPSGGGS